MFFFSQRNTTVLHIIHFVNVQFFKKNHTLKMQAKMYVRHLVIQIMTRCRVHQKISIIFILH